MAVHKVRPQQIPRLQKCALSLMAILHSVVTEKRGGTKYDNCVTAAFGRTLSLHERLFMRERQSENMWHSNSFRHWLKKSERITWLIVWMLASWCAIHMVQAPRDWGKTRYTTQKSQTSVSHRVATYLNTIS